MIQTLLILMLIFGIVGFLLWLNNRFDASVNADRMEAWEQFARGKGLVVSPWDRGDVKMPVVTGTYRGRKFSMKSQPLSSGTDSGWTLIETKLSLTLKEALQDHLELYYEGGFQKLGKVTLGTQDIKLGDRCFDDCYMVQCSDFNLPARVLKKQTRKQLLSLIPKQEEWHLSWKDRTATASRITNLIPLPDPPELLELLVDVLSDVADRLEGEEEKAKKPEDA